MEGFCRCVYCIQKQSCFLICYKEWKLLWRQIKQCKISSGSLAHLTLTWYCSHSDEASGRTWLLSLCPCLSGITQGPATTWRLMMATSTALHSLVKTENNHLTGISHTPFNIPCVLIKSSKDACLTCGTVKVKWKKRWDCGSAIKSGRNSILQTVIMGKFACGIVRHTWL